MKKLSCKHPQPATTARSAGSLQRFQVTSFQRRKRPPDIIRGLSLKTVRNINQVISSALSFAKEQRLIIADPIDGCALPKLEHKEMKTLTAEQLTSFLREAKESGVYELYYIELATGLRRGELLGLKWENVDFTAATIHVRRQVARISGEYDGEYPLCRCLGIPLMGHLMGNWPAKTISKQEANALFTPLGSEYKAER